MSLTTASIVTYHTPDSELDSCLASLGGAAAVWIVDNSRSAATEAYCRRRAADLPFELHYVAADNRGYGAGHNIAIRRAMEAGADYHLVVNSDVEFAPAMLSRAVAMMERDSSIGLLHPRLRYPSGEEQYTVRLVPSPFDLILRRFLPGCLFRRRRAAYELRGHDRSLPIASAAYVQGSFMLLRVDALRRVGLFDERFFMYPEDIDLSRRIASGPSLRVAYAPEIEAVHAHRAASRRSPRMLAIHIVNMIRYFNKWGWVADRERRRLNALTLSQV